MSVLGGCPKRGRQTGRRFGGEFLWGGPDGSGLTWGASGRPPGSVKVNLLEAKQAQATCVCPSRFPAGCFLK